jgi:hypothetical protein
LRLLPFLRSQEERDALCGQFPASLSLKAARSMPDQAMMMEQMPSPLFQQPD